MEELNKLLETWHVASQGAFKSHNWKVQNTYNICIQDLTATLKRAKRSCNTRMHVDTKPITRCVFCDIWESITKATYCGSCGERL